MMQIADNKTIIDFYVKRLNKAKWDVIFRTDNGIQVKRQKQVNKLGFICGLLLLPFWGLGLFVWLIVMADYALQPEKIMFITVKQMIEQFQGTE